MGVHLWICIALLPAVFGYWVQLSCNCNGRSNRCYFDNDLYRRTGHGGHCIQCADNTAGVHCERCKDNFYRRRETDPCVPCNCDPEGSVRQDCDSNGMCRCKPGVTGDRCDRCAVNFYDFGPFGCRECECSIEGSFENRPVCSQDSGMCQCKEYVEGLNCDTCKPGYFGLTSQNPLGCLACFCYGHSSVCDSARGFTAQVIQSDFSSGMQGWSGQSRAGQSVDLRYDGIAQNIGVSSPSAEPMYFVAPERYLGDQRYSYSRNLSFTLRVGEEGASASVMDVVIEGDGITVRAPIYAQGNPVPRTFDQDYTFVLQEHQSYQWSPSLSSREFIRMLSNVQSIRIRATYTVNGVGFLDNVKLESARQGGIGESVSHIEQCRCLDGYVGQFCEDCEPGYHRDPPNGGPLARCVPCNCHGHSDQCDVNTGKCICQHNTVGDNCERCAPGYYGYALEGTPNDCQRCPCPDSGECVELLNGDVACINCQEGYTGNRCEMCADGYFGDPEGRNGPRRPCQRCQCNDNVDPNAILNCNTITGECLKCVFNTGGFNCERCLPGFYGDALASPKGQCLPCNCYGRGSRGGATGDVVSCNADGQCPCLRNVEGLQCDKCREGFWNIDSGSGCDTCDCDVKGSYNRSCDVRSGQCYCKPGVTGKDCGQCQPNYHSFSAQGCRECECDPHGSTSLQCDVFTGHCSCKPNIEGKYCDKCMENKYDISAGCIDCPACYNLVQDGVNDLRRRIQDLEDMIKGIGDNPINIDDEDFKQKMAAVNQSVNQLLEDARNAGGDSPVGAQIEAMRSALMEIMAICGRIHGDLVSGERSSAAAVEDLRVAERLIEDALRELRDAESYIDNEGQDALQAAIEAQDKAGQQSDRLTEIAKEATELAKQQEQEAADIRSTADEALNTSTEAYRIIQEALDIPYETGSKISDINRDLTTLNAMYENTKRMSEQAFRLADEAFDESARIFLRAEDLVSTVDADYLKQEAQNIKDEAADIKQDASDLIAQHEQLIRDIETQKVDAEALLQNGVEQQQVTDELLAEADLALNIARDAVAKAEKTLKDAQDTLETLRRFDDLVRDSKDEAEAAMGRIDEITRQIEEAEDTTREANINLADAQKDAIAARDIAEQANGTANMASDEALRISNEAAITKDRAYDLNDEADRLRSEVDEAERRLEQYETDAQADDIATEALEKAERARVAATEAKSLADNALNIIDGILRQLENLGEIDVDKMDDLERNLDQAEADLIATNIDIRYEEIMRARDKQHYWKIMYFDELEIIQKDIENIRVINETIPRDCFREIEIEPVQPGR